MLHRIRCSPALHNAGNHLGIAVLAIIAIMFVGCQADADYAVPSGDSWDDVLEQGSGTLSVLYVPSGGFAYHDDDGELTGATIEILREFVEWTEDAYDVSINVEFDDESEWQRFYQQVAAAGEGVIGIGNVTITEERRQEVEFSPPYLNNVAVLASHEDRPELQSMEELPEVFAEQTGLVYPGTLHGDRMEALREAYYPEMPVDTVRSNAEIMELMAEGDYYFTYLDVYNFAHAQEEGVPLKRHEIADDEDEQFAFIMPPGSDWAGPLDEFFRFDGGFVQSETYREIIQEHLGEGMADLLLE